MIDTNNLKILFVKIFLSYDDIAFCHALKTLGISANDSVMVHSSWNPRNGFKGRPIDMINAIKSVVGTKGLISMPSLTYQNESSKAFLMRNQLMDVRRSPSKMGLLSEVFRRGKNVYRSLSPTHPMLAWGDKAEWFVSDHDKAISPFGQESPFDKLLQLKGKILLIDATFSTITFTHFLEDRIASFLPFPLYEKEAIVGTVADYEGNVKQVAVKVLSEEANKRRKEQILISELERNKLIKKIKIGNTRLSIIDAYEMTCCVDQMTKRNMLFFD
jgi:aminoglycoside 3-N-acetyltransferase